MGRKVESLYRPVRFWIASLSRAKLYYSTADFVVPGRQQVTFAPATAAIEIGEVLETKIAAFKAHTSQQPLWPVFEGNTRKREPQETFHLAAAIKQPPLEMESDLFAGIVED